MPSDKVWVDQDGDYVEFELTVRVPAALTEQFQTGLTGNDDDVVMAAEKAMRRMVGDGDNEQIEVQTPFRLDLALEDALAELAELNA